MRIIALFILALATSSVLSQNCGGPNFLSVPWEITVMDNTNQFHTVAATDGYTYCSYSVGDSTCCSVATVNGFQKKAEDLIDALEALAATRDQHIIGRRGDVLALRDDLNRINEAITFAAENTQLNSTNKALMALASGFGDLATALITNFKTLKEGFLTYQENRATCIKTIVETQAAAWCLACGDLDSVTGVDTNTDTIIFDTNLVTRLSAACYPYIEGSATQSQIISVYNIRAAIADLATGFEIVSKNDVTGTVELTQASATIDNVRNSDTDAEKPVSIPTSCTAADCSWIESTAFLNGALQNDEIIMGGTERVITFQMTRLLGEENGRNLQVNGWVPAENEAGITVTFEKNPGNVDNDANSALLNSVIVCIVAIFALFL